MDTRQTITKCTWSVLRKGWGCCDLILGAEAGSRRSEANMELTINKQQRVLSKGHTVGPKKRLWGWATQEGFQGPGLQCWCKAHREGLTPRWLWARHGQQT